MVFSSLIFLYAFLPLSLLAYFCCGSLKSKNICLLVFSLMFYSWGEPKYILLLLAMSFFDWFIALRIQNLDKSEEKKRKAWLTLAIIINLSLIGVFKYGKMFCRTFGVMPEFIAKITLPLGISFYTFQLISYVIDVYRGEAPAQEEYWHVLLFAALFHQCIAGPIVRYKTISYELFTKRKAYPDMANGCFRFCLGLFKKVILANACGSFADALILSDTTLSDASLFASNISALSSLSVVGTWVALLVATMQMYFDFSAYSDMAIGMGKMIGLHYPENFNYPYLAKTANEYWRRWHMTLGQWFRDYLYYPLNMGPAIKLRRFFTKKVNRKTGIFVQNLFTMVVIWACTGLWHGGSWAYAVWGLYWCFFMILEQSFLQRGLEKLPGVFSHLYLAILLIMSRVFFRFDNISYSWAVFKSMFGLNGNAFLDFTSRTVIMNNIFIILFCMVACTPLIRNVALWIKKKLASTWATYWLSQVLSYGVVPLFMLLLSTAALVGESYNPFLYYRF